MKSINPVVNKLIIVEGLTGLGKSTLAHFIARQLRYNDIEATWVHEGELGHPLSVEVESGDTDLFMQAALAKWQGFVSRIERSGEIIVLEAGFFNNMLETLFLQDVPFSKIYRYSDLLQDTIAPLQPALVYLTHSDVSKALADNFRNRGAGFQDFVIKFATTTPYAQHRGLVGNEGMIEFWVDFVTLTDQLYDRFRFQKLALLNSNSEWETLEQQILDFLSIEYIAEQQLPEDIAADFTGTYIDQRNDRAFTVRYRNHDLVANLFLDDWIRLIPTTGSSFLAAGWHFIVQFNKDSTGKASALRITGQDVDYLSLVGTVAERVSN